MKKALIAPITVLIVILGFALWNSGTMNKNTARWRYQLQQADFLAQAENSSAAETALEHSYHDWCSHQTYLHIVSEHDAVDDAEAMYLRAIAFAATQEPSELRAEIADLQAQLRLLAEMEHFSIKNIL